MTWNGVDNPGSGAGLSVVGGSISAMSSSTHDGRAGVPVAVDRAGVLGALRADREAQHAAEVAVLRTTVDWAMLHASWDWDQADHDLLMATDVWRGTVLESVALMVDGGWRRLVLRSLRKTIL